ncbi:hypothetical protein DL96DRAFT_1598321 [Flagelloscypha sp. PMI_526]|nr:hypothetical protein DL96DRAFT_1598321 [Flagelloscypha sp. PMI_526]
MASSSMTSDPDLLSKTGSDLLDSIKQILPFVSDSPVLQSILDQILKDNGLSKEALSLTVTTPTPSTTRTVSQTPSSNVVKLNAPTTTQSTSTSSRVVPTTLVVPPSSVGSIETPTTRSFTTVTITTPNAVQPSSTATLSTSSTTDVAAAQTNSATNPTASKAASSKVPAIVGGIFGGVLGLALLVGFLLWFCVQRRRRANSRVGTVRSKELSLPSVRGGTGFGSVPSNTGYSQPTAGYRPPDWSKGPLADDVESAWSEKDVVNMNQPDIYAAGSAPVLGRSRLSLNSSHHLELANSDGHERDYIPYQNDTTTSSPIPNESNNARSRYIDSGFDYYSTSPDVPMSSRPLPAIPQTGDSMLVRQLTRSDDMYTDGDDDHGTWETGSSFHPIRDNTVVPPPAYS